LRGPPEVAVIVSASRRASFAVPDTSTGIGASALAPGPRTNCGVTGRAPAPDRALHADPAEAVKGLLAQPMPERLTAWRWLLAARRDEILGTRSAE